MKTVSETKTFRSFGWMVVVLLLSMTALGRLLNHFYSITATDIMYADWVSAALGYIMEALSCLQYVFGFGAVLYAQRKWGLNAGNGVFGIVALTCLADMGARFLIDYLSNSIRGVEIVAMLWLLLQFAYELIILALCWLTGRIFLARMDMSDSVRRHRQFAISRAFRFSLLYVLILRILIWLYDVVDFVRSYSQIQNYEYASMAGQLIYVLVLYGGAAFLFSELVLWFLSRTHGKCETEYAV